MVLLATCSYLGILSVIHVFVLSGQSIKIFAQMMEPTLRTHQFTCVVNKKHNPAVLLNAVGHMLAGLVQSHKTDTTLMRFRDFVDQDGTVHPVISENGLIVLRSENSNQLRVLRNELIKRGILFTDFTATMLKGDHITQQQEFSSTPESSLEYIGVSFFVEIEVSRALTRRFSLYVSS